MKNSILILLIMFISTNTFAQSTTESSKYESTNLNKTKKVKATIYLKNGSVIYGVLEQNDDIVVIKTNDGNIFAYPKTAVEKIELNTHPIKKNGAYHQFGFGLSHSETEFNGSFKVVNGYQLASKIYFGLGIGFERYYTRDYVPILLDVQYHPLSNWNSQPYLSLNYGKLMMQSDENNGWLTGIQLGFSHPLGNKVDICTTIGYRHGYIEREYGQYDWGLQSSTSYRKYEINRLEIGLGFLIK